MNSKAIYNSGSLTGWCSGSPAFGKLPDVGGKAKQPLGPTWQKNQLQDMVSKSK
jgi:hypothetical protein